MFGICVQVTYGSPDPYLIIEWFELQRLLGVSMVGLYAREDVSETALKVIKTYVDEGFVELRHTWQIAPSEEQFMLHGSPVINDCMYRNMNCFKYILVIDFDEVIMPKTSSNLSGLVDQLDRHYTTLKGLPPASHIFANNYFFLELPPDLHESPYLTFMRFTKRIAPSKYGYSVKSMIDPQGCVNMHNHYCWSETPGLEHRAYLDVVNSSFAINQHHKKCHLNVTECQQEMSVNFEERTMERFKPLLRTRVKIKISRIFDHNI